jgi:uncharacterized protein YciI
MYYVIYCEDQADSAEKRRSVRPAHLKRLELLEKENRVLAAGAMLKNDEEPSEIKGSMIIADFNNLEEAKAWAAADPYVTAEVYANVAIYPFKKVFPANS